MNKNVEICFICDNNYVLPTIVAITSLMQNKNIDSQYNINVVHSNLDVNSLEYFNIIKASGIKVNLIPFVSNKYQTAIRNTHATTFALVKFDLPNIFPNIDKLLYIDGDTIIQSDLSTLYNTDLANNYLAAVRGIMGELKLNLHKIVGVEKYFNSGIMLLNLKSMRENNITTKLIETKFNQPKEWWCMDQDALNYVCKNKVVWLHPKYNCSTSILNKEVWSPPKEEYLIPATDNDIAITIEETNKFFNTKYKDYKAMQDDACIIHYLGSHKPWQHIKNPVDTIWDKYYKTSVINK